MSVSVGAYTTAWAELRGEDVLLLVCSERCRWVLLSSIHGVVMRLSHGEGEYGQTEADLRAWVLGLGESVARRPCLFATL